MKTLAKTFQAFLIIMLLLPSSFAHAEDALKVGDLAPAFSSVTESGKTFALESRRGHWTVLFFYPKAGTPGCTKQACAFRDGIKKIRARCAEVFGLSADTVEAQRKFHDEHQLKFSLLADPDGQIVKQYGAQRPLIKLAQRWTFIIDPELRIRAIDKDVDPVLDAERTATTLASLGASAVSAPKK